MKAGFWKYEIGHSEKMVVDEVSELKAELNNMFETDESIVKYEETKLADGRLVISVWDKRKIIKQYKEVESGKSS